MTTRHLWYHAAKRRQAKSGRALLAPLRCDPQRTAAMISNEPQPPLGWLSRFVAFVTTPFKFLGISGWTDTGCSAQGTGSPVRDAQHSTNGFWTIDVKLNDFQIGPRAFENLPFESAAYRYIRIEIEPGTGAHDICSQTPILAGRPLSFAGPVLIDTDGPFLEIHPDGDFQVGQLPAARDQISGGGARGHPRAIGRAGVHSAYSKRELG
ncbi:MAG: hypothetical protein ACRD16_17520 [Thermoanaerobaculia bacterium]